MDLERNILNTEVVRKRLGLILILVIGLIFSSCSQRKITIGIIGGISGGNAELGEEIRNTIRIYLDDFNSTEKGSKTKVSLIILDDGNNADMARNAARELIEKGVDVIIGPFTSSMTDAVMEVAEPAKLLVFSPTASALHLVGKDDYLFRLNASTTYTAGEYARYVRDYRKIKNICLGIDLNNRSYSESWAEAFRKEFIRVGDESVHLVRYDSSLAIPYVEISEEILRNEPGLIILVSKTIDVARFARQIRIRNDEIPLMAAEWAGAQSLIELGGSDVQGLELFQAFDQQGTQERVQRVRREYSARFGRPPSVNFLLTYETLNVVLEAFVQKKRNEELKDAIITYSPYQGLQKEIHIDAFGDVRPNYSLMRINDLSYDIVRMDDE